MVKRSLGSTCFCGKFSPSAQNKGEAKVRCTKATNTSLQVPQDTGTTGLVLTIVAASRRPQRRAYVFRQIPRTFVLLLNDANNYLT